jgi:CheY-like chemotaxis protein
MPSDLLCRSTNMTNPGGNHRMLIVDDEKIVGETLASIFTTRGHVARAAQSAEEAIEVLAELAA